MSQVMSAMPSWSTSNLKLVMAVTPSAIWFAGFVRKAHRAIRFTNEIEIDIGIVRTLAGGARADFEIHRVAVAFC